MPVYHVPDFSADRFVRAPDVTLIPAPTDGVAPDHYNIQDGIMHACVKKNIPFVLTGSIRDDGPLPEVVADVYCGQNDMRGLVTKATTVICMATQLHTIATGNMTPSFCVKEGVIRPVFFYTVDISEFAVNKLRDRGSLSVVSFIANAQDFLVHVMRGIGKEDN